MYVLLEGISTDAMKNPKTLQAIDALESYLHTRPFVGKTVSIAYFIKRINQAMHGDDPAYYTIPDDPDLVSQYFLLYSISGAPDDFNSYIDYDYRRANLAVYIKTDSSAYVQTLVQEINDFAKTRFDETVQVRVGGSVPQSAALSEVMVRGKLLNIAQIAAVVFVVSALLFRSLVAGALVLLPLLVAVIANFGLMGISGILLNVPTSLTSAMAVGIGADYAIYLIYRLREELATNTDELAAVRRVIMTAGQAVLFVAIAVACGYGVLLLSFGFKIHQWLAILIGSAMLVSAFAALLLIPSLLLTFRPTFMFRKTQ
ncbi:MAG: MMPL family transporter [Limnobacter sp.]|nr:MMPL family transporter [Limnobacter sp.]